MIKRFAFILLTSAFSLQAATVSVEVQTAKAQYRVGQTVEWSVTAGASTGDNRGITMLSVNLSESAGETINLPLQGVGELLDTEFGIDEGFTMYYPGAKNGASAIDSLYVMQMPTGYQPDIANDGASHLLAKGSYVVTALDAHVLSIAITSANKLYDTVDINDTPVLRAVPFESYVENPANFTVYGRSDVNYDGSVDILDLQAMADQWLMTGSDLQADIYPADGDGTVNMQDFAILAEDWLLY